MKKLNTLGFSHYAALAIVVVLVAVGGTYSLVASHADTNSGTLTGTTSVSSTTMNPGQSVIFSHTISLSAGAPTTTFAYGVRYSVNDKPVAYPGLQGGACSWPNTMNTTPSFNIGNCGTFVNRQATLNGGGTLAGGPNETDTVNTSGFVNYGDTLCEWIAFSPAPGNNGTSNKACVTVSSASSDAAASGTTVTTSAPSQSTPTPAPVQTSSATHSTAAAPKPTPVAAPPKTVGSCPNPAPLLVEGNKSDCVKYLQSLLGITADGDFGPQTLAAVKAFQGANHLSADGKVGHDTWAAFGVSGAANAEVIPVATAAPASHPVVTTPVPSPASSAFKTGIATSDSQDAKSASGGQNLIQKVWQTLTFHVDLGPFHATL